MNKPLRKMNFRRERDARRGGTHAKLFSREHRFPRVPELDISPHRYLVCRVHDMYPSC
jgi:hypothetical protein